MTQLFNAFDDVLEAHDDDPEFFVSLLRDFQEIMCDERELDSKKIQKLRAVMFAEAQELVEA